MSEATSGNERTADPGFRFAHPGYDHSIQMDRATCDGTMPQFILERLNFLSVESPFQRKRSEDDGLEPG
jgi:hypothetical protein